VADSTADTALAMRARVEELVRLGYDRDQIEGWFVDRYGAWVQLEPPAAGRNLVLYVAPLLALGLGLGLGLASWWRSTRGGTPPSEPPAPTGDAPASVNPYRQRVLSQIEEP
jgi:cytochrome c-type biogenesis protein CcmH